jgi:hypothetical protein
MIRTSGMDSPASHEDHEDRAPRLAAAHPGPRLLAVGGDWDRRPATLSTCGVVQ